MMLINKLSQKQREIFKFAYEKEDAIACDGAVRSGKTLSMSVAFVLWAMANFKDMNFAICGKTIQSAERNILKPLMQVDALNQAFTLKYLRGDRVLTVSSGGYENKIYLFGGKDESSYTLVQGITLARVLFDEVALMPKSFVDQAIARTLSIIKAKLWFNCNPESPQHWFYKEWIKEPKNKSIKHLHFFMEDNPILGDEEIEKAKSMFSGVFYDRYILGKWTQAEGLIYPMFNDSFHIHPDIPRPYQKYYISADYGTQNPMSMGLWGLADGKWYRMKEYYYSGRKTNVQKTDEEYYDELVKLAGDLYISKVIIDPSAASFIVCIKKHGKFRVEKAVNDVLNGIQNVANHLKKGDLLFNACCTDTVNEFKSYSWDSKAKEDKPIKDNDHAMDDVRYFVNTILDNKHVELYALRDNLIMFFLMVSEVN